MLETSSARDDQGWNPGAKVVKAFATRTPESSMTARRRRPVTVPLHPMIATLKAAGLPRLRLRWEWSRWILGRCAWRASG
jgi:hypothetical protein